MTTHESTSAGSRPRKHFGRAFGIGILTEVAAAVVTVISVIVNFDEEFALLDDFQYALLANLIALVIDVVLAAVPALRRGVGSAPGVLLGWLVGLILQVVALVILVLAGSFT
ncbi:hypothetical protein HH310_19350 [Actinoplanes sp. TBRC 11911]|uniref:hypothetical protein n=1 Tax=Actinoplanes sp. TBRC 11911 TaxID=2729386 RepID=UPI00145CFF06|nr:hypothetical protein [Actinoplanes sp. TBRC 11911]NMO53336.1 hypothetical protein [Actinoplanes sp. TBRC 11911]